MTILEGKPWRFEQQGGARKVLELAGWAGPMGRARGDAVVNTPINVRTERTHYPTGTGSSDVAVTRHIFGIMHDDWELRGRFRDKARGPSGGKGFAKSKTIEVEQFVADQQPVRIFWGDILAAIGFIVGFDPAWEAEHEVAWIMRIEVDRDDNIAGANRAVVGLQPLDYSTRIAAALNEVAAKVPEAPLPSDLMQTLDSMVSVVAGAAGALQTAAEDIQSMKDATFAQLNRLQASVATLARAGRTLRETFASIPSDAATLSENADASIALLSAQATVDEQLLAMAAESAALDRAAGTARAKLVTGSHVTRDGDTWESLSTQLFGRPDRAADLVAANNIPPGQRPIAGFEYLVPR